MSLLPSSIANETTCSKLDENNQTILHTSKTNYQIGEIIEAYGCTIETIKGVNFSIYPSLYENFKNILPGGATGNLPVSDADWHEFSYSWTTDDFDEGVYVIEVDVNGVLTYTEIVLVDNSEILPSWIKNNVVWWANEQISDIEFVNTIKFLILSDIIPGYDVDGQMISENDVIIPSWIKTTAIWWGDGTIPDSEFLDSIDFMINNGIIDLKNIKKTQTDFVFKEEGFKLTFEENTIPTGEIISTNNPFSDSTITDGFSHTFNESGIFTTLVCPSDEIISFNSEIYSPYAAHLSENKFEFSTSSNKFVNQLSINEHPLKINLDVSSNGFTETLEISESPYELILVMDDEDVQEEFEFSTDSVQFQLNTGNEDMTEFLTIRTGILEYSHDIDDEKYYEIVKYDDSSVSWDLFINNENVQETLSYLIPQNEFVLEVNGNNFDESVLVQENEYSLDLQFSPKGIDYSNISIGNEITNIDMIFSDNAISGFNILILDNENHLTVNLSDGVISANILDSQDVSNDVIIENQFVNEYDFLQEQFSIDTEGLVITSENISLEIDRTDEMIGSISLEFHSKDGKLSGSTVLNAQSLNVLNLEYGNDNGVLNNSIKFSTNDEEISLSQSANLKNNSPKNDFEKSWNLELDQNDFSLNHNMMLNSENNSTKFGKEFSGTISNDDLTAEQKMALEKGELVKFNKNNIKNKKLEGQQVIIKKGDKWNKEFEGTYGTNKKFTGSQLVTVPLEKIQGVKQFKVYRDESGKVKAEQTFVAECETMKCEIKIKTEKTIDPNQIKVTAEKDCGKYGKISGSTTYNPKTGDSGAEVGWEGTPEELGDVFKELWKKIQRLWPF